jgi:hypothetical protein
MWVLSPLLPSASQKAVDEGALPNPVQFLTSGKITIGRPAKKGGTTGKADILIFNESSVSTLHAAMEVQPAADDGTHGTVTLTGKTFKGCFDSCTTQIGTTKPVSLASNELCVLLMLAAPMNEACTMLGHSSAAHQAISFVP